MPGFAELHHHMFAEEAFGGGWFHGSYTGTLTSCDGGMPESDHARVRMDLSNLLNLCPNSGGVDLSGVPAAVGAASALAARWPRSSSGRSRARRATRACTWAGARCTSEWPRWDTIAHQQSWEGWLRKAHDGGMSLVMVSLVSNEFLCKALPYQNLQAAL